MLFQGKMWFLLTLGKKTKEAKQNQKMEQAFSLTKRNNEDERKAQSLERQIVCTFCLQIYGLS